MNDSFPMPKISIQIKLPLMCFLVVAVCMACFVMYIFRQTSDTIGFARQGSVEATANVLGDAMTTQIRRAGRDMILVSGLPGILEGVCLPPRGPRSATTLNSDEDELKRYDLTLLLEKIRRACFYYELFILLDEQGNLIAGEPVKSGPLAELVKQEWFADALQANYFLTSSPMRSPFSGEMVMPVSLRVSHNGKIGILLGLVQLARISNHTLASMIQPGLYAYLVDNDGEIIASQDPRLLGKKLFEDDASLQAIWEHPSGQLEFDFAGERLVAGYRAISQTSFFAVVAADRTYMGDSLERIDRAGLVAGVFTALAAMLCLGLLLYPLTRDIRRLSLYSQQVARRENPAPIKASRTDELGSLANDLNSMVHALGDAVSNAEAATAAKGEFLARMSHEIRTPMNGILGLTYLAMQAGPDAQQMGYLKGIDTSARTLLVLINDILDFSKLEAGKMECESVSFSLGAQLHTVRTMLEGPSHKKGLDFSIDVNGDVPDILRSDPVRITQICVNLCNNAIKFTKKGSVHLQVSLLSAPYGQELERLGLAGDKDFLQGDTGDDASFFLLFSVTDTGIGISRKAIQNIFESFTQADGSITRQFGGTGLGLAICKTLSRLLGGDIWVDSREGEGSCFRFVVRVRPGSDDEILDTNTMEEVDEQFAPMHVLLVEDNKINQMVAKEVLEDMGIEVTIADNGKRAIEYWEHAGDRFDAIFMDVHMPLVDGITATRTIRSSLLPRSATVPIIAMTADAMSEDRERVLSCGMNDYISKPLDIGELRRVLHDIARQKEDRNATAE